MEIIVGIDLGTSTSEIGYMHNGKPTLIPNHLGELITPSVVHIKEDGSTVVGQEAKELLVLQPESTFMEVKRLIGSDQVLEAHGKTYTPEQITAFILRYLVDCANAYFSDTIAKECTIVGAVITVPAYFTDVQRRKTIEAGKLAGLEVKRIINEPTAASLDYGLSNIDVCQNILVYDLGGGTLDVTVLELFEGVVEVKATCGNNELGGKEFDQAIIDDIKTKFRKKYKVKVENNPRAIMRLKEVAETSKILLSNQQKVDIELPFFMEVNNNPVSINESMSREYFESLIADTIQSTTTQIYQALEDSELKPSELDMILLVGGSTKIPYITKFLEETLGQRPQKLIDPDLGVALGATIQAGIIHDDLLEDTNLVITDVCPYTLSNATLIGEIGYHILVCDPLIPRNTTIPVTREKVYVTSYRNQEEVTIDIYQGESTEPSENKLLNSFMLDGVPKGGAGKQEIKVSFSYDLNGVLHVTATIVSTGKALSVKINTNLANEEIDTSGYEETALYKKYRRIMNRAEKVLEKQESSILVMLIKELKEALVTDDAENAEIVKEEIIDLLFTLERGKHE